MRDPNRCESTPDQDDRPSLLVAADDAVTRAVFAAQLGHAFRISGAELAKTIHETLAVEAGQASQQAAG